MGVKSLSLEMELRAEAIRARDEHGNTDFYALLIAAADRIRTLETDLRAEKMSRTMDAMKSH